MGDTPAMTLREKVAGERRRLKSVREVLTAAVARKSGGDGLFAPFYIAIGDYIETSMGRLHAQDVKMGNMIRAKLGTLDAPSTQALRELDERLAGNQEHLRALSAAKENLAARNDPANLASFEAVGAAYTNYIVANMGHHGGTTDLAGRLFTPADWDYMAGVSDEETRTEEQQYARVFGTLPPALNDLRPAS
jgi:hypothetical protein